MKRELKVFIEYDDRGYSYEVTKPIPMKRELKDLSRMEDTSCTFCHKANPDEKGTERSSSVRIAFRAPAVTKPIPMKRELKVDHAAFVLSYMAGSQSQSR